MEEWKKYNPEMKKELKKGYYSIRLDNGKGSRGEEIALYDEEIKQFRCRGVKNILLCYIDAFIIEIKEIKLSDTVLGD